MSLIKFETLEGKGSKLTLMVSEWNKINKSEEECFQEAHDFYAPSECYGDIAKGFEKDKDEFFKRWDMEADAFFKEVEKRTNAKFVHFHLG